MVISFAKFDLCRLQKNTQNFLLICFTFFFLSWEITTPPPSGGSIIVAVLSLYKMITINLDST